MEFPRASTSKLTAFLFSDIEGSSVRWLNHRLAMEHAVALHDEIIRKVISGHAGKVFKSVGDSSYAAFDRPADAVGAAVALQEALAAEDWSSVDGLKVRMAVHVGSAEERGDDYFGPALNRTARLLDLGHGGQILLTASTAELLAAERDVTVVFIPVGRQPLDDPSQLVAICQVVANGKQHRFPTLRSPKKPATVSTFRQNVAHPAWVISILLGSLAVIAGLIAVQRRNTAPAASPPAVVGLPTQFAAATPEKSVAVLSFTNLSDDKQNEYFSDGVSEELLNVLAKVPGLKVSARTSSFHFKGKDTPIPEIAKQLGVAYVVEGSVRKSGNRVRITAQLINAGTGFHVWSDNFDRELKDIFVVQDEIAALIAKNLELKLAVSSQPGGGAINPEAYRLYLEGRQAWTSRTNESLAKAGTLFRAAIDLDPGFARAYVGLADSNHLRGLNDEKEYLKNLELVDRALQLDPNLAEAHASRGNILFAMSRHDEASVEFERALALNPNYATAHQWYGRLLWGRGELQRAEEELRRGEALDPIAPIMPGNLGLLLVGLRRYRDALAAGDRALALQPNFDQGKWVRARALLGLNRLPEAAAIFRELFARYETGTLRLGRGWLLPTELALVGDTTAAQTMLAKLNAAATPNYLQIGFLLQVLGRSEEALNSLAKATPDEVSYWLEPIWDPVREDPRFLAIIEKSGQIDEYRRYWRVIVESEVHEAAESK